MNTHFFAAEFLLKLLVVNDPILNNQTEEQPLMFFLVNALAINIHWFKVKLSLKLSTVNAPTTLATQCFTVI